MSTVAQTVGANVRRLRRTRGLSLVELGQHAGLAKGTLTQLEAGRGNPTVDTLHALGAALGISVADLVTEPPDNAPRVVRADEGPLVAGWSLDARLIYRTHAGSTILELYGMQLEAGSVRDSPAHTPGVVEQVYVLDGTIEVGPEDATVTLSTHDFARYDADRPHRYAAPDGPAAALITMIFPSHAVDPPTTEAPEDASRSSPPRGAGPPRAPRVSPPQIPVRGVRPPSRTPPGGTASRRRAGS